MHRAFRTLLILIALIVAQSSVMGQFSVNVLADFPALRHHAQQLGEWVKEARRYAQDAIKLKRMMENGNIAVAIAGQEIADLYSEIMGAIEDYKQLKEEFSSWDANYGITWKIDNENAAELTDENKNTLFTSNMWDGEGNPLKNNFNLGGVLQNAWNDSGAGKIMRGMVDRLQTPEGRIKAAIERKLKERNKKLEAARFKTIKMVENVNKKIIEEQETIGKIREEIQNVSTLGTENGRELRLHTLRTQLAVSQSRLSSYQSMATNAEINQNLLEREAKEAKEDIKDMQDLKQAALAEYYERKAEEKAREIRRNNRRAIEETQEAMDELLGSDTVTVEGIEFNW